MLSETMRLLEEAAPNKLEAGYEALDSCSNIGAKNFE
jgi:hypothetical protein